MYVKKQEMERLRFIEWQYVICESFNEAIVSTTRAVVIHKKVDRTSEMFFLIEISRGENCVP